MKNSIRYPCGVGVPNRAPAGKRRTHGNTYNVFLFKGNKLTKKM